MKITAQDIFIALYDAFHKLEKMTGPEEPELTATNAAIETYNDRVKQAQKEVEVVVAEGATILDKYVDGRIKKIIAKMKYDGELK